MPPKKAATKKKRTMSDEHKAAIAEGRAQAKAVSDYLEALAANKRRPGRQRTAEKVRDDLAKVADELAAADAIGRLNLEQRRLDLEQELAAKSTTGVDTTALEAAFVEHAAAYAARKGISYGVWRKSGVPAAVLTKAGISRSS